MSNEIAAPTLKLVSTQSTRQALEKAIPEIEARYGMRIAARYVGVSVIKRTGTAEIDADIFVGPSDVVEQYVKERSASLVLRSQIAVSRSGAAFRSDVPIPDISTTGKFLEFLRAASAVAYSDGMSGDHLVSVLERHGLGDFLRGKRVKPEPGGSAATPVAQGLADVGVQQISEMLSVPGVNIVELPEEFRKTAAYDAVSLGPESRKDGIVATMDFFVSRQFQDALAQFGLRSPHIDQVG